MIEGKIKELGDGKYYLGCACHAPYCCVMFCHDAEDDDVTISPQLNHYLPWYTRIWHGAKYMLGMRPDRCHYVEIVVDLASLDDLAHRMNIAQVDWNKRSGEELDEPA